MKWKDYITEVAKKCKRMGIPYTACFELTPFCNFSCDMCYVRLNQEQAKKQGELLSTQQWIHLAEEAKIMGVFLLEVTGGEAITRKDFPFLYRSLVDMGFLIRLRTNGYLINEEIIDLLKDKKPQFISITLYGATDETYQKICGISDGFSIVTKNILLLKQMGIPLRVSMTVTKENCHEILLVKRWAKNNNISVIFNGGLHTPIRSARRSIDHLKMRYSDEECEIGEYKIFHRFIKDREKYMNPFWMCTGFGSTFCITWDGRVTLCNSFPEVWKNPFKNGLNNAYHDLYDDLKKLHRPKECSECEYIDYCFSCPSKLYSESGNPEYTCEEICRVARRNYKAFLMSKTE